MCEEEPFTSQFEGSRFAGTVPETPSAQERARKLSERLINAQEEERRRIARELHDDLNQRLALLSIEMDLLCQMPSVSQTELGLRLHRAAVQISELSSDLHKLSYRLHPAKLDQLGLVAAGEPLSRIKPTVSNQNSVCRKPDPARSAPGRGALYLPSRPGSAPEHHSSQRCIIGPG